MDVLNNIYLGSCGEDGIPDGKEIHGYEVKIITGWKDNKPISQMKFISSSSLDPLVPYGHESGEEIIWSDTDGDGIPDVAEIYLANHSKWSTFKANYPELWSEYSWIAGYYNTIESRENEGAANEWLKSQFNPLIKDHTPPVITKFTIKWVVKYSVSWTPVQVYAKVHLVVRDVGGINNLQVVDKDSGESVSPQHYGATSYEIEHKFSASLWQAGFGSVHIGVVAKDYAGNTISVERELKGAFGQVLDALGSVWHELWQRLERVAREVAAGASMILEWIKSRVTNILNKVLDPVWKAYDSWIYGIYKVINRIIIKGDTNEIDVNLLLKTLFGGTFVMLISLLAITIIWIIEPLVIAFEYLTGLGGVLDTTLSTALLHGAKFMGRVFISVAISTPLIMFGEVLSAVIPHNDPALSMVSIALEEAITKDTLSKGDVLGLVLTFIGFSLSLAGSAFQNYAHLMAVIGAVIAGVGLAIALGSPDLPGLIGWLDEGIDAILFGWAVYDAVHG